MSRYIIMLGPVSDAKGGVSSVVQGYIRYGLFQRWPIKYLPTCHDGNFLGKFKAAWLAYCTFFQLIFRNRIALIHAHTASRSSFWRKSVFFVVAIFMKCPYVIHLHGAEFMTFFNNEAGVIKKYIISVIFNRSAKIVVLSNQWKEDLETITNNKNIVTIFNSIHIADFSFNSVSTPRKLLFLGKLGIRKGVYDLLVSIKQLSQKHGDLKLLCGGDGETEEVRNKAVELGIKNSVDVLGWVSGKDKEELYAQTCIYVLPSYDEGLPMGILEAMAAGLPVVSTPVGGIPDAIENNVEGILVSPGDIVSLTDALEKLLSNDALRRKMGRAARKKAEKFFSAQKVIPQIEKIYEEFGVSSLQ